MGYHQNGCLATSCRAPVRVAQIGHVASDEVRTVKAVDGVTAADNIYRIQTAIGKGCQGCQGILGDFGGPYGDT